MRGTITQVSLSKGGIPKFAVPKALAGTSGLEGDVQRNRKYHGGPRQALLMVSSQDLDLLRSKGFAVLPGDLGENLTITGIDFRQLRSGMRFRAGAAVIELTKVRTPCSTLDVYNTGGDNRIQDQLVEPKPRRDDPAAPRWAMGGFYTSVLIEGMIRPGDIIELLDQAV